jgi:hypothetical protein
MSQDRKHSYASESPSQFSSATPLAWWELHKLQLTIHRWVRFLVKFFFGKNSSLFSFYFLILKIINSKLLFSSWQFYNQVIYSIKTGITNNLVLALRHYKRKWDVIAVIIKLPVIVLWMTGLKIFTPLLQNTI